MKRQVQIRLPSTYDSVIAKTTTPVSEINTEGSNRACYRGAPSPTENQIDDIFNQYKEMILQKVSEDPKYVAMDQGHRYSYSLLHCHLC
jgi:hypothetical protein